MTATLWIALAAAGASIASAVFAFRNGLIAKRALALSRLQREDREREVEIYLIDSSIRRNQSEDTVAFALSFINKADINNSIVRIDVEVHYLYPDGRQAHLLFPAAVQASTVDHLDSLPLFTVPVSIGPRAATSGWAVFRFDRKAIGGRRDHYSVVAITALGKRIEQQVYLMREIIDENPGNPK